MSQHSSDDVTEPTQLPWWLGGDRACGGCYQLYAIELSCHCYLCDGVLCPHCVVHQRGLILCPECAEQET